MKPCVHSLIPQKLTFTGTEADGCGKASTHPELILKDGGRTHKGLRHSIKCVERGKVCVVDTPNRDLNEVWEGGFLPLLERWEDV